MEEFDKKRQSLQLSANTIYVMLWLSCMYVIDPVDPANRSVKMESFLSAQSLSAGAIQSLYAGPMLRPICKCHVKLICRSYTTIVCRCYAKTYRQVLY